MSVKERAAEAFISKRRDDFRTCLNWQDAQIEKAVARLPVRPPLFDRLRRSQKICVTIGAHMRRFAFFNDMGTGKTFIAMALADYYREAEGAQRFLVLVPNRVNINGWLAQIAKHAPELKAEALPSNIDRKYEMLSRGDALLFIETYAGFSRLCSKKGAGKNSKLVPDPTMIARMGNLLHGIIVDESSALGNHNSLQTNVVTSIAKLVPKMPIFLLSGTPFGRDPHLLWPQFKILDNGYSLGETLGLFRSTFFTTKVNNWGGYEYNFQDRKTPLLHKHIAHRSIRFCLDEADLPAVTPILVELDLAADASRYYAAALNQMRAARGNYQLTQNAFSRMRQISSGYVNVVDQDTGAREQVEMRDSPKLEWIKSQVPSMDGQIIVFHDFIHSGLVLKRELDKLDVSSVIINGQVSAQAVTRAYDAFTTGKAQVLLLNSAAGAYGLNLQMAKYGIYFESPVPVIIRKQTQLRFIRPESLHKSVVMIDLVCNNTVDKAILDFHEQGKDLFSAILDGSAKL